ncbi:MAG: mraY [Cytophagaceae bacterium]|jgi:phospho-N-acetylmuramoyl-pentapeptide-transferase|nr:mraY [Cytophagaceae bacterium]
MFYYLFNYLDTEFDFLGAGVFKYISFRAVLAAILSLALSLIWGGRIIRFIRSKQIGESVRDLGLQGQIEKTGTPTMGGIMILISIIVPTLLFAKLDNVYIILLLVSALWMGLIGFLDDYIKVFKKNKEGLKGTFKVIGQITLGLIVGGVLVFNDSVVIREYILNSDMQVTSRIESSNVFSDQKDLITTIPFLKNNEFDYSNLLSFVPEDYTWIIYMIVAVFIITAVSNGANMTDGIDGLAAGTSAIIGVTFLIFAYVSGNAIFSSYLNIMFIPNSGEIVVFCAAFVGACIGFLWYNSYPAQVFMGDTGSLMLGGVIAVLALTVRKELLLPVICGIFLVENLSVMLQVGYFKYTRKKYGEGRRIFKMAPLHHHYQKMAIHESKIVTRFWIVGILLAILAVATLKLR